MPLTTYKSTRLRSVFVVYWFLLAYIIAALVWWFIALTNQNRLMTNHDLSVLQPSVPGYHETAAAIRERERRKEAQYIGEGAVFFLVILAGAVFIFRAVRRQLKLGQQQQHFMMAITHELKTPIAVTKLNLETLQKRRLDEEKQQQLIRRSIQETNRLNSLCNNILLAAQMEENKYTATREELDFSELVHQCLLEFRSRYPERRFDGNLENGISLQGDPLLLQLAVNNLLDNAHKYSPRTAPVQVSLKAGTEKIVLTVTDEGKGIPGNDKKKIFGKFYRIGNKATREAKGTGLGLYLTRKIAREHRGEVFVTDHSPTGSNFVMELGK
jgi:signal transduction histidine kinase